MKDHNTPHIAIIVGLDEHNAIGRDGGLLCRLPSDLKHFRELTTGHCIIMGRKTYESLPKGALPHRTNIVVTSRTEKNFPGCIVVRSIQDALANCNDEETLFIIGGGELYRSSLHLADRLYLTRIHHTFDDADTFFPKINLNEWKLIHSETHKADDTHAYDYSFLTYIKQECPV